MGERGGHTSADERSPWNPRHIGILALVLSPVPAAVVHALNWRRLGLRENSGLEVAKDLAAAALFVAVIWLDAIPPAVMVLLGLGMAAYFGSKQVPEFQRYIREGGHSSSFKKPTLYSTGAVIGFLLLALGASLAMEAVQEARLQAMFDEGDFDGIEAEALSWLEEDPRYPDAHWNLALVYSEMERWDDVVEHLRRYIEVQPEDVEAREWLAEVELYLKDSEGYEAATAVDAR